MKRPYITLKVRLAVLERQAFVERQFENGEECDLAREWYEFCCQGRGLRAKIRWLITLLFAGQQVELDHDPALELRRFNARTGKYTPDANNPKFLVYRTKPQHLQKTTGRAPGAERTVTAKGSDTWLAKKFRRLERPKASKSKIPSRGFPKARRTIRSRSSFATPAAKGS